MSSANARRNSAAAAVDRAVRAARLSPAGQDAASAAAFDRLLRHVRRSQLLRPWPAGGCAPARGFSEIIRGLMALATHQEAWLRPVEAWEPAGSNPWPQFASLARHLLAEYPVAGFMTSAWFGGHDDDARRPQGWFIHIGAGRNIRTADLPLPYTRRMAHHFLEGPDHLSVAQALRRGQVVGLGGSERLARAVVGTRLGHSFDGEDFWLTVVQFLANHPELDLARVGPLVDYLHHQRFVPEEALVEEGEVLNPGPPQPDLSMKGRTPRSLLRQVAEWQRRPKCPKRLASLRWSGSGIAEFRHVESDLPGAVRCWTIRELTSREELLREGEAMRHCVARYAGICARRVSSIWSLRFETDRRRFRIMTIEVDLLTRTVCQASRRGNATPNEKALGVVRRWAEREGLRIEL